VGKKQSGFTIIEVLVVLAIAALILLIVFLAIPKAQSNYRNYDRKHYVNFLHAQMIQYKTDTGKYPKTQNQACTFLSKYAGENGVTNVDCLSGFGSDTFISAKAHGYTIAYFNNDVPHDYIPPVDEIDIALSHWCNVDPTRFNEDPSHPITNGNEWPYDGLFTRFVIWTSLEHSTGTYCVDDYPRDF
jgi:prepilin-type N-terminal cleavage/methylation domain-containing protein